MFDPVINWIVALALVQLFATAAWHKFSDMNAFKGSLSAYEIVPVKFENIVAGFILVVELMVVVLLVIPAFREVGALLACGLLLAYASGMAINIWRGRSLADCGCHFGSKPQAVTRFLVARNLVLALGASLLIWPESTRQLNLLDFGSILFGLAVITLIYTISNSLSQSYTRLQQAIADGDL
ncbi:hypothetical protein R50073_44500 [Maricurvus nonylphenolicus]|uniref:MauE/DoxX family redox-associated membrane protein n=1 Tax=Maricurvus nonylphenolicus TaxID=1008307 RepID=UPI0036F1DC5D